MSVSSALTNISVGKKLTAGFVSLVLLAALIAVTSLNTLDEFNDRAHVVADVSSAESYLLFARTDEKNFIIRKDQKYITAAKKSSSKAAKIAADLKPRLKVPADHERIRKIIDGVDEYHTLLDKLAANIEADAATLNRIQAELRDSARATVGVAVELQEVQVQRMEEQFSGAVTFQITLLVPS